MSIASAINDLKDRIDDAYTALSNKGATIPVEKTTANLPTTINSIPTSSSDDGPKVVKFIDYDGTVLHEYTRDKALSLTELPSLPTKSGLICSGWNYTLSAMKSVLNACGSCTVGAIYTSSDGNAKINITIRDPKYTTVSLLLTQSESVYGIEIDWGDGSSASTYMSEGIEINASKTYTPSQYPQSYVITIRNIAHNPITIRLPDTSQSTTNPVYATKSIFDSVIMTNIGLDGYGYNFSVCSSLQFVMLSGVTNLSSTNRTFINCKSLKSLTIPNNVTSIPEYMLNGCNTIESVSIPNSVTSIEINAFYSCKSLRSLTIPNSVTSIGSNICRECYALQSVTIPDSITIIDANSFQDCYSLQSVTIPYGVTKINSNAFRDCWSLKSITIPDSVTTIGTYTFTNCYSLESVTLSNSITSIGQSMFSNCQVLKSITLPDSITKINNSGFGSCYSLQSITFPSGFNNIGANAFNSCYGLKTFDFRLCTSVPTLQNVSAFTNTPETKEIIVPDSLYNNWIAASNWSSDTNQIKSSIVKASESSLGDSGAG